MAGAKPIRALGMAILAASLLGAASVQRGIERQLASLWRPGEALYLPEGAQLHRVCMGHEGLLASIYWTRAVQYFGRKRIDQSPRFDLLGPLLRVTTDLDPHLLVAYRFGAVFLTEKPPRGAGLPQEALQLLRKGIVANPGYWRLWQDLGFIYYWDLKDYPSAARAFRTGSERPGAAQWMKVMAAAVTAEGGELRTSRLLWEQIHREAETESIRRNAEEHLAALKAQEDLAQLNMLLEDFARRSGRNAVSWRDLIATGQLREIPADPYGSAYRIGRQGRAELSPASRVDPRLVN